MIKIKLITATIFSILLMSISGCSSSEEMAKLYSDPQALYKKASVEYTEEDDFEATELLNRIRTDFPQSTYATLAELMLADIEYRKENFLEAAILYQGFYTLHPRHEKADYALYRQADAYFKNAPSHVAKDQSSVAKAASAAKLLVTKYPRSNFITKAIKIVRKSRLKLAQKEAYIAAWYSKKDVPAAAIKRLDSILSKYADLAKSKDPEAQSFIKDVKKRRAVIQNTIGG